MATEYEVTKRGDGITVITPPFKVVYSCQGTTNNDFLQISDGAAQEANAYEITGLEGPIEEAIPSQEGPLGVDMEYAYGSDPPTQEAPPGFEGEQAQGPVPAAEQAYGPDPPEVRRSPRIKRKMNGPYVPIIERAQRVLGYEEAEPRKKKSVKAKGADKNNSNYTHTLSPLTEIQAELIVAAAGVELDESLQVKVNKAMEATIVLEQLTATENMADGAAGIDL